jgi:hypothetical protein
MAVPSTATIELSRQGTAQVRVSLHLSADTFIACYTYTDHPPILSVDDGPARFTVSVPDRDRVTEADLDQAHRLADAVDHYVTELEIRLAKQDNADRSVAA